MLVDALAGKVRALLCDFGLSQIVEADSAGLTTSSFHGKGSPRYMSPELLEEGARRGPESDVWAWGCVVLEARVPF